MNNSPVTVTEMLAELAAAVDRVQLESDRLANDHSYTLRELQLCRSLYMGLRRRIREVIGQQTGQPYESLRIALETTHLGDNLDIEG